MKTRLLLFLSLMCGAMIGLQAQINVTFQVDMAEQAVLSSVADSITVAGDFQEDAGFPSNWTPGSAVLVDTTDGDSVFTLTVNIPAGSYEYKFVNGVAWGSEESIPAPCNSNNNRALDLTGFAGTDTLLPLVCFAKCDTCVAVSIPDTVEVTMLVDMSNEMIADTVSVAGDFQAAAGFPGNWSPGSTIMTDTMGGVADSIYELVIMLPEGTYSFKYVNGTAWGQDEGVPAACNVGNNRQMIIENDGSMKQTVGPVCFARCDSACPVVLPPIMVTFRVDMNNEILSDSGVFVAGDMQDPNWVKNRDLMVDTTGDGFYTFTYELLRGEYQFKFFNGANGDPGSDEFSETAKFDELGCGIGGFGNNRWIDLNNAAGDTILPAWQYNSCTPSFSTSIDNDLRDEIGFKAFPNPAKTLLNLSVQSQQIERIELLDMSGRIVRQEAGINQTRYQINRENLPAGLYILKVKVDDAHITQKVMFD